MTKKLNCRVLGRDCLEKDCIQWNPRNGECAVAKRIGEYLYQPLTGSDMARFLRFLEGIRPDGYYK
jgi:hypothetical protein